MRRMAFVFVFAAGCSTAPYADFMDHFFPAKIDPQAAPGQRTRGGVCDPHQSTPAIGPGNPANTPSNPAVPGQAGGPPMLPVPGAPPGGAAELPAPAPPSPPGGGLRW